MAADSLSSIKDTPPIFAHIPIFSIEYYSPTPVMDALTKDTMRSVSDIFIPPTADLFYSAQVLENIFRIDRQNHTTSISVLVDEFIINSLLIEFESMRVRAGYLLAVAVSAYGAVSQYEDFKKGYQALRNDVENYYAQVVASLDALTTPIDEDDESSKKTMSLYMRPEEDIVEEIRRIAAERQ